MAAASKTASKPAAKPAKPTAKGIGPKELAEHLGTTPYELRKVLRSLDLGIGRGARYRWPSMTHPDVKRVIAAVEESKVS